MTNVASDAWFGFSPCYDCPVLYQFRLGTDNNQAVEFRVNNEIVAKLTSPGILSTASRRSFLVQTLAYSGGGRIFNISSVDCGDSPPTSTLLTYITDGNIAYPLVIPSNGGTSYNTSAPIPGPFAITYAVFGGDGSNAAKFSFEDGNISSSF